MPRARREPIRLSRVVVDAIHNDQLREHGGLAGTRDDTLLESALARPRQKWHYDEKADMPALAAAYAFGVIKNHPYRDGNKRIGFLTMVTFLEINGYEFEASEAEVVVEIGAVADGRLSETGVAEGVRSRSTKV